MIKEALIKGKDGKPIPVEINKGLVLERKTKRITNLSKNEKIYAQGDGVMKIAPFDNYYLFTIYSELNMEDIPVDIHNMGSFFLTFKDKSSEIRIENYKNTRDIDPTSGQILFRISQEEAEKILALNTNIFYITSMLYDNISKSDETVLYSGRFAEYNDASINSLTDEIAKLNTELNAIKKEKEDEKKELQAKIDKLTDLLNSISLESELVKEELKTYKNMYDEVSKDIKDKTKLQILDSQDTVSKIEEQLKRISAEMAINAKTSKNKSVMPNNKFMLLERNTLKNAAYSTTITSNITDKKISIANIEIKDGIVNIYAVMHTSFASLDTEAEKTQYNYYNNVFKSLETMISSSPNKNIKFEIVYAEKDTKNIINTYNIKDNCVLIVKNDFVIPIQVNIYDTDSKSANGNVEANRIFTLIETYLLTINSIK